MGVNEGMGVRSTLFTNEGMGVRSTLFTMAWVSALHSSLWHGCQLYTLHYHRGLRGAGPTINKAFSKVVTTPYYQTQELFDNRI
jgi:hypothetical protein